MNSSQSRLRVREVLIAFLLSVSAVSGAVWVTGNFFTGPRLADDNQIYKLQIEFREDGFAQVLSNEFKTRLAGMRRLVPVHSIHKIVQAKVLGGNMLAWHLWVILQGALTAWLLYCAARLCGWNWQESAILAAITVIGEQCVVWWRLLQPESIGMVFLAAALVAMGLRIRTGRSRYEVIYVVCFAVALMAKEAFLLTVPGLLLWKVWLTHRERAVPVKQAVWENRFSLGILSALAAGGILLIRFGFRTTSFNASGWVGFDRANLAAMLQQYATFSSLWLAVVLGLLLAFAWWKRGNEEKLFTGLRGDLLVAVLVWLAITTPQLLLHMSTGMLDIGPNKEVHYTRYMLPCMLGMGIMIAELLRLARLSFRSRSAWVDGAVALALIAVFIKGTVAFREGASFARESKLNDQWFEDVVRNTDPDDPIVLVYLNYMRGGYPLQAALRVYYIMSERHGRSNFYYLPIPGRPTIDEQRMMTVQEDTRRHARTMNHVAQMFFGREARCVMVLNWGRVIHREISTPEFLALGLIQHPEFKFNPASFDRRDYPQGDITYFRKK